MQRKSDAGCVFDLSQADANTLLRNPALYVTNNNLGYILAVSNNLVASEIVVADIASGTPAAAFSVVNIMHAEVASANASTGEQLCYHWHSLCNTSDTGRPRNASF
jgi:hypothetical protein